MDTKPQKHVVTLTLDAEQWKRLRAWIDKQGIGKPKKNALIDLMIKRFLEENGG